VTGNKRACGKHLEIGGKVVGNESINNYTVAGDRSGEGQSTQTITINQWEQQQWVIAGNDTISGERSMIGGVTGWQ
jgi:hypothetical protein